METQYCNLISSIDLSLPVDHTEEVEKKYWLLLTHEQEVQEYDNYITTDHESSIGRMKILTNSFQLSHGISGYKLQQNCRALFMTTDCKPQAMHVIAAPSLYSAILPSCTYHPLWLPMSITFNFTVAACILTIIMMKIYIAIHHNIIWN